MLIGKDGEKEERGIKLSEPSKACVIMLIMTFLLTYFHLFGCLRQNLSLIK